MQRRLEVKLSSNKKETLAVTSLRTIWGTDGQNRLIFMASTYGDIKYFSFSV
jgi:hypothetical protein